MFVIKRQNNNNSKLKQVFQRTNTKSRVYEESGTNNQLSHGYTKIMEQIIN